MEQTITLDGEITVEIDAATIRLMNANGLALWHTQGASECYLAPVAQFVSDYCVATAQDVLDRVYVDDIDEVQDTDVATFYVWI